MVCATEVKERYGNGAVNAMLAEGPVTTNRNLELICTQLAQVNKRLAKLESNTRGGIDELKWHEEREDHVKVFSCVVFLFFGKRTVIIDRQENSLNHQRFLEAPCAVVAHWSANTEGSSPARVIFILTNYLD